MAPATSAAVSKSTSPTSPRLAFANGDAVDTHIDDGRAGLQPVAPHHLGLAHGRYDDVPAPHHIADCGFGYARW
jgi:hypothetical protein